MDSVNGIWLSSKKRPTFFLKVYKDNNEPVMKKKLSGNLFLLCIRKISLLIESEIIIEQTYFLSFKFHDRSDCYYIRKVS